MRSDFHVHFPPEMAGLLAHIAHQKKIEIPALIEELTAKALKSEQKFHDFAKDNLQNAWLNFSNKFDESEWTWP